ncbi:MAG TPA: NAD(P)/FAD-dependent oxidoreductase [Candidatus Blautia faecigallinarum]|uniref:NAD(P)/FAD-dependent oxidoreductase n=1 Tax=Candidatus Blautia faecigallinarum TaxID=2838488 RepID=A0A9D2DSI3_9FIRM|nr:NAD(P)/FAD-dependent oxidoreductase [Candidatus Blautia faecigallinarum]
MRRTVVIGGGASGLAASIAAAGKGADVTLVEQKELVGKKILSTGNGRCNLTNLAMSPEYYRGGNPDTVEKVLHTFGTEDTVRFFRKLGIITKARGTYLYPKNDQASSVREALALGIARLQVETYLQTKVEKVSFSKGKFDIYIKKNGKEQRLEADRLILAAGGKASPGLGSDGSGYQLAKNLGHTITPVFPALVQLTSDDPAFRKLAGVRSDAKIVLMSDETAVCADQGEIQFTDYGLSGIPVFQVSRFAAEGLREGKPVSVILDFLPEMQETEICALFREKQKDWSDNTAEEFLRGIFHRKLVNVLLTRAHIRWSQKVENFSEEDFAGLACLCKKFEVKITGTRSFDQAQVCAGGVSLEEIDPLTMESLKCPGLYITGELLDVDGMCGGYNLQWAWATGHIAGEAAAL